MTTAYLVADLFCGAGGSSTGAKRAIAEMGMEMELVAVNHWPVAVETHRLNHPTARHYVQDLDGADPEAILPEGRLDLLMASPECRFYSRARGGRPVHDQGRMNPWIVHRWLTSLNVRCLLVENVPEFTKWGPLGDDGRPDKARKGLYFEEWVKSLWGLGYNVEWRMLNAADYGDATTRVRFFLQARNDGQLIRWPEATHTKADGPSLLEALPRWRAAREVIDWTNPGRSLLDDPKYRRKPLSEKTRRRIARGLERFGGPLAHLYVRLLDLPAGGNDCHTGGPDRTQQPFIQDRGGENGAVRAPGAGCLIEPQASPFTGANRNQNVPRSMEEPVPLITTAPGGGNFLVEPGMEPFVLRQQSDGAPRAADEPVPTVTADGAISLVQPSIIEYYGQSDARTVRAPLSTVMPGRKHGLVNPTIVEYYGQSDAASVDQPLPTITGKVRHGLANPALVELNHGNGNEGPKGDNHRTHSVDQPLGSLTTTRGIGIAQPILVQTSQTGGNGSYVRPTDEPVPTLTTRNDMGVATPTAKPYLAPSPDEHDCPAPDAGSPPSRSLAEPILKQALGAGIDPRRLVLVDGQPFLLDIRFRMLQNAELARAMGFEDEETSYEFVGNVSEITKQIGNAVPVHLAAALVKAALGNSVGEE